MPLPDANNYSTRIYELLKETDLQNLSYSQFQQVAETLFIEPENEDEMRRLVLVQLARIAVRGDWDGFLTGAGTAPVTSLVAGTDITLSPVSGLGDVTINAAASPVTSLIAGTNLTLSPVSGLGDVTINADTQTSPVTSLVAGTNVTLSPVSGLGDVTINAAGGTGAPDDAQYVTLATDATLTNERVLTAGAGITLTDAGAGSTVTIAADASPVTSLVAGTNVTLSPVSGLGDVTINAASGGVSSVTGTSPIVSSGGLTPAISLADTAVTPGSYTSSDLTIDSKGRITAAASGSGGVSYPLLGTDGSAAAPTYSFASSTNLGFLRNGLTSMAFSSGGVRQMSFDASGRLKLGDGTDASISTYTSGLLLNTNGGTNSGSITLNAGVNTDIDLVPDGTGSVKINAGTSLLSSKFIVTADTNALPVAFATYSSNTSSQNDVLQLINSTTSSAIAGSGPKLLFRNGDVNFAGYESGSIRTERIDNSNHDMRINAVGTGKVFIRGLSFSASNPPSSSTDTGVVGSIEYDSSYIYVATGTNQWKRAALSSW